jgi:mono/diheme cytochrome c family protein
MVLLTGLAIGPTIQAQAVPQVALPAGDSTRGKAIVESSKGNCLSCHRIGGAGSLYGPDLSAIGQPPRGGGAGGRAGGGGGNPPAAARGGAPPPAAGPPAAPAAVPPAAAPPAAGRGGNPPAADAGPTLQQQLAQSLLDPNAVVAVQNRYVRLTMKDGKTVWGKLLNLDTFAVQIFDSTEKLANVSRQDVRELTMMSPMPSYRDKLTAQELSDVVEYLLSLKGQ